MEKTTFCNLCAHMQAMGISSFVAGIGLLIFPYINSLVGIFYFFMFLFIVYVFKNEICVFLFSCGFAKKK